MNFRLLSLTFIILLIIFGGIPAKNRISGYRIISDPPKPVDIISLQNYQSADSIAAKLPEGPLLLLNKETLTVSRNNNTLNLHNGSTLQNGDIVETSSGQFAVIFFTPDTYLIIHPASKLSLDLPVSIHLTSAVIQFESGIVEGDSPDMITCHDSRILNSGERSKPSSFMMQCRGQSGIFIASHSGSQQLINKNKTYAISAGNTLMERTSSSAFLEADLPDQPIISDSIGVKDYRPVTTYDEPHQLIWQPVPMADQYLLHIISMDTISGYPGHYFNFQSDRTFSMNKLESGSHEIRVAAMDYYGVMSIWSEPYFIKKP